MNAGRSLIDARSHLPTLIYLVSLSCENFTPQPSRVHHYVTLSFPLHFRYRFSYSIRTSRFLPRNTTFSLRVCTQFLAKPDSSSAKKSVDERNWIATGRVIHVDYTTTQTNSSAHFKETADGRIMVSVCVSGAVKHHHQTTRRHPLRFARI